MENEFKIEIGIDYKKEDIETLRNNLSQIQDNFKDIKITLNTTQIDNANKTLENIKKNLKEINDSKVNLNINTNYKDVGNITNATSSSSRPRNNNRNTSSDITASINNIKLANNLITKMQTKLNSSKMNLKNLNADGVVKDFKSLSNQIDNVEIKCKNLAKSIKDDMSTKELNNVVKSMKAINDKTKIINNSIENSKNNAFSNIKDKVQKNTIKANIAGYAQKSNELKYTSNKTESFKNSISNVQNKYSNLETAINNNDIKKAIILYKELDIELVKIKSLYQEIKNEQSGLSNKNAPIGDIKKTEQELNSILSKLDKSSKYLANLNADGAVKDFKSLNKQITKTQDECQNLMNTLGNNTSVGELDKITKSMQKLSNESNLINSNIENSKNKIFNNITDRVNSRSIDSVLDTYKNNRDNLSDTNNIKFKRQVSNNISNAESVYSNLQTAVSNGDVEKSISLHRQLNVELDKISSSYKTAKIAQSLFLKSDSLEIKRTNALREIEKIMNSNSIASKRYAIALNSVYTKLKQCDTADIQLGLNQWKKLNVEIKNSGLAVESFITRLKYQFRRLSTYITATFVIDKVQQSLRTMYNNVVEIDKAMTELYRVTSLTPEQYTKLYSNMIGTAKEYGSTLNDIINSTADWSKLGFDATTSNKLAGITTMYQNITDVDTATAVNDLVTAYKGFQGQLDNLYSGDQAKSIEYIADIFNLLGNKYAVSANDVGNALERSSSSLSLAGNSIQESAAMATGITEVTQDSERAGKHMPEHIVIYGTTYVVWNYGKSVKS